ncbi:hypothetical protein DV735_g5735, partial [Chaetothyriales sp. CBS 134920]
MALPATSSFSSPSADLAHDFSQPPHGRKRRHSDVDGSNGDDPAHTNTRSAIATGLKKLRLAAHSAVPPTTTTNTNTTPTASPFAAPNPTYPLPEQPASLPSPLHLTPTPLPEPSREPMPHPRPSSPWPDSMMLDYPPPAVNMDTGNRVVINDLDAELAEIDAEEEEARRREQERLFFLPDEIDRQVSAIPAGVLRQGAATPTLASPEPANSQALILYREPHSFGLASNEVDPVAEAKQRVRMARQQQRMRDRQKEALAQAQEAHSIVPPRPWPHVEVVMDDDSQPEAEQSPVSQWQVKDEDAMDLG